MRCSQRACFVAIVLCALFSGTKRASADAIFNFEANLPGTPTPFTDTVSGLSATFGGLASVCASEGLFQSLSGNVLIQSLCGPSTQSGPLTISFSSNLAGISFDFATAGGAATMTLTAFENAMSVGTVSFTSTPPPGFFNGEGLANFSGTFNRLTLTSGDILALDNVKASAAAVPEPASLATIPVVLGVLAAIGVRRRKARF